MCQGSGIVKPGSLRTSLYQSPAEDASALFCRNVWLHWGVCAFGPLSSKRIQNSTPSAIPNVRSPLQSLRFLGEVEGCSCKFLLLKLIFRLRRGATPCATFAHEIMNCLQGTELLRYSPPVWQHFFPWKDIRYYGKRAEGNGSGHFSALC